jgi:hypothetical protein
MAKNMPEYSGSKKQQLRERRAIFLVSKGFTSHEWLVSCPSESAELRGFESHLGHTIEG